MSSAATPSQFRKVVVIVSSAHLLLILLLSFWSSLPVKPPETITLINLESFDGVSAVESTKGPAPTPQVSKGPVLGPPGPSTPAQAPAAPAPEPEAAPEPPTAQPVTPEPSTPLPPPAPKVAPPAPVTPPPKIESTFQTKPKIKPKIKVSTKVVARANDSSDADSESESAAAPSKSSSKATSSSKNKGGAGKGVSASEISGHLGSSLSKGGLGGAVEIGPVSQPGGGAGNFGSYYTLIRQQMTDAWDKPIHLNQADLSAVVKITIEKDGRISNVSLLTSSGQSEFDRSIMAAAQRVGRIREPLPEGMEGHVLIRFRLQD